VTRIENDCILNKRKLAVQEGKKYSAVRNKCFPRKKLTKGLIISIPEEFERHFHCCRTVGISAQSRNIVEKQVQVEVYRQRGTADF